MFSIDKEYRYVESQLADSQDLVDRLEREVS